MIYPKLFPVFFAVLFAATGALRAQDPDIDQNEENVLEDIFRSSDVDGEIPTAFRDRGAGIKKRVSVPAGAKRVGCVCMDGSRSEAHSAGACSGSGGVRFWVYKTPEGDTTHVLTARHERHPHALDSIELSEVNQTRRAAPRLATTALQPLLQPLIISTVAAPAGPPPAVPVGWFDWSDAAAISGGGFALYLILRLLLHWVHHHQALVRYALRHLLRFGKRPPARKNRKSARKTRL